MRTIFDWVGQERCSIGEVCRRLRRDGIPTRTGKPSWDRATVCLILKNPAYRGKAAFGKTRAGEYKPQRLRPQRGRSAQPRRPVTTVETSSSRGAVCRPRLRLRATPPPLASPRHSSLPREARHAPRDMGVGWVAIVGLWNGRSRGSIGRGSSDCGRTGVERFTKH